MTSPHQCVAGADHADGADREQRQGHRVVAGPHAEVVRRPGDDPGGLAGVARRRP